MKIIAMHHETNVIWGVGSTSTAADQDAVMNGFSRDTDELVAYRATDKAVSVVEEIGGYDAAQLGAVRIVGGIAYAVEELVS